MGELLEQIKKLSRQEQLELADQIYAIESEEIVEDAAFLDELKRRAEHAVKNPQSGIPWEVARERLLAQIQSQVDET